MNILCYLGENTLMLFLRRGYLYVLDEWHLTDLHSGSMPDVNLPKQHVVYVMLRCI